LSKVEIDSNVRLLFIGVLVLISGVALTNFHFDNFAYAETESIDDTRTSQQDALKALERAKSAIAEDTGTNSTGTTEETTTVDAGATNSTGTTEETTTVDAGATNSTGTTEETTTVDAGATNSTGTTEETTTVDAGATNSTGTTEETTVTVEEQNERTLKVYTDEEKNTRETTKQALVDDTTTTEPVDDTTTTEPVDDTTTTEPVDDTTTTEPVIEPVKAEMTVYVDNIEDSSSGQMVYIKGDGAVDSQKVVITILGDTNEEIVELSIYSTNSGEFSTIWIIGSDLGDGTYTIKVADPSSQAETTFTITGTAFVTEKVQSDVSDTAETLAGGGGEVIVDDTTGDSKVGAGFLYDKQFKDQLNILEQLIAFIQGLVESMETEMYAADDALQIQIDDLAAQTIVVTYKEVYITILSGTQSTATITCPAGEVAQSGGVEIMTTLIAFIDIYANHMDGTDGWFFQASNSHPTDDIQVKLYVNCIKLA